MLVDNAVDKAAQLPAGGHRTSDPGYVFAPTALANAPDSAKIINEDPFGPTAMIPPWTCWRTASPRPTNCLRGWPPMAARIRQPTWTVWSKAWRPATDRSTGWRPRCRPPSATVKWSGYGREDGEEGLRHYSADKNLSHRMEIEGQPGPCWSELNNQPGQLSLA